LWINRASADELAGLPRVGPAIARRIVEMRASRGPFRSEEDLMRVRGIGPKTVRSIAPFITFATDSEAAAARDGGARSTRGDSLGR
jgi:competence ComEA-like helix-hairpin-helix protein